MPKSSARPTNKTLILMRHAKRASGLDLLAPEGHKQAEGLLRELQSQIENFDTTAWESFRILASPKIRTQQSVRFLSATVGVKTEVVEALDERRVEENQTQFEARVRRFLEGWQEDGPMGIRLICSHLDWLEAAAVYLTSEESDLERAAPWPPMEIRSYVLNDGIWVRLRK